MAAFKVQLNELHKLSMEARDNVKFLTTLERHFKAITNGPLSGMRPSLPCLTWNCCKEFSTCLAAVHMRKGLLQRISVCMP